MTFSGEMTFNPLSDALMDGNGKSFKFQPPFGTSLPGNGFEAGDLAYGPSQALPSPETQVIVSPDSDRLALLSPFSPYNGDELKTKVLIKVAGKCTTDHISAAGTWLKYKGHLENISYNTLIGATNAATGEVNKAYDERGNAMTIPQLMMEWKGKVDWVIVGEHNYGEGSAREHAALQPRYLGARVCRGKISANRSSSL